MAADSAESCCVAFPMHLIRFIKITEYIGKAVFHFCVLVYLRLSIKMRLVFGSFLASSPLSQPVAHNLEVNTATRDPTIILKGE